MLLACACVCLAGGAQAAPLDDLLTADTPAAATLNIEGAIDAMDNTLDVFKIRANDPVYGGTNVGNYTGQHVLAGYALTDRLWLDGGFWDRHITYHSNIETLQSWQTGAQYRFAGNPGSGASYGLRLSAWGDTAGNLAKSTPTTFYGQQLSSVNVSNPDDTQVQADLLGSWKLADHLELGAFVGGGLSSVSAGTLTAGYGGCEYGISLGQSSVSGTQIGTCGDLLSSSFYKPTSYDVSHSLSYKADYSHLGLNARWTYRRWTVKGGYELESWNRRDVDTIITSNLNGTPYKRNNVLDGDIAYRFAHDVEAFVHGEAMSNQFLGEIPFSYNIVTASKFNGKYGFMSFGLRASF